MRYSFELEMLFCIAMENDRKLLSISEKMYLKMDALTTLRWKFDVMLCDMMTESIIIMYHYCIICNVF